MRSGATPGSRGRRLLGGVPFRPRWWRHDILPMSIQLAFEFRAPIGVLGRRVRRLRCTLFDGGAGVVSSSLRGIPAQDRKLVTTFGTMVFNELDLASGAVHSPMLAQQSIEISVFRIAGTGHENSVGSGRKNGGQGINRGTAANRGQVSQTQGKPGLSNPGQTGDRSPGRGFFQGTDRSAPEFLTSASNSSRSARVRNWIFSNRLDSSRRRNR